MPLTVLLLLPDNRRVHERARAGKARRHVSALENPAAVTAVAEVT